MTTLVWCVCVPSLASEQPSRGSEEAGDRIIALQSRSRCIVGYAFRSTGHAWFTPASFRVCPVELQDLKFPCTGLSGA